jgi:hypothetical protein
MRISELKSHVRGELVEFAWDQWAQMGVSGAVRRSDRWAADPEALLLFTLEVARADARLFDEVLDWLVVNERLVSVQRLRNLCRDDADRSLVEASLAWAGQWRPRARLGSKARVASSGTEPLLRGLSSRAKRVDETFQAHGWLKPPTERSGKSQAPAMLAAINFAFRLRQILGVGARAEAVRFLLTDRTPRATVQVITESVAFAKRNVQEALTALHSASVVDAIPVANEQRYSIDRERWAALLGLAPDELPTHVAWPELFHAMRRLLRWLEDEADEDLSDYMVASDARVLAEAITPELRYAGVKIEEPRHTGADYWQDFVALVEAAIGALTGASVSNICQTNGAERADSGPSRRTGQTAESPVFTGISRHDPGRAGHRRAGS